MRGSASAEQVDDVGRKLKRFQHLNEKSSVDTTKDLFVRFRTTTPIPLFLRRSFIVFGVVVLMTMMIIVFIETIAAIAMIMIIFIFIFIVSATVTTATRKNRGIIIDKFCIPAQLLAFSFSPHALRVVSRDFNC